MNVYDFSVRQADEKTVSLEQYKGMVWLIVNTASDDRYAIQLPGLKKLYIEIDRYYYTSSDIKWNFTKFLIGRDGGVIKRLEPEITPETLEADIIAAMGNE